MQVILKETIETLGLAGSEVKVSPGYARNYLFPKDMAVAATEANRRVMEQNRRKLEIQIAKEKEKAEETAAAIDGKTCRISAKVSPEGKLYGSVSPGDIVNALAEEGLSVSKKMVLLKEPIKEVGTYPVSIYVYKDVLPEITVEVTAQED